MASGNIHPPESQFFSSFVHRPADPQELFNLRHASLRNVIERIFGICKRRFKLMVVAPEYNLQTQAKIPAALAALHNFIRIHDPDDNAQDEDDYEEDHNLRSPVEIHAEHLGGHISQAEKDRASAKRDAIATAMWVDYQNVLAQRGQL